MKEGFLINHHGTILLESEFRLPRMLLAMVNYKYSRALHTESSSFCFRVALRLTSHGGPGFCAILRTDNRPEDLARFESTGVPVQVPP